MENGGKNRWEDRERNEEVLRKVSEERELLTTISRRKSIFLGHVI